MSTGREVGTDEGTVVGGSTTVVLEDPSETGTEEGGVGREVAGVVTGEVTGSEVTGVVTGELTESEGTEVGPAGGSLVTLLPGSVMGVSVTAEDPGASDVVVVGGDCDTGDVTVGTTGVSDDESVEGSEIGVSMTDDELEGGTTITLLPPVPTNVVVGAGAVVGADGGSEETSGTVEVTGRDGGSEATEVSTGIEMGSEMVGKVSSSAEVVSTGEVMFVVVSGSGWMSLMKVSMGSVMSVVTAGRVVVGAGASVWLCGAEVVSSGVAELVVSGSGRTTLLVSTGSGVPVLEGLGGTEETGASLSISEIAGLDTTALEDGGSDERGASLTDVACEVEVLVVVKLGRVPVGPMMIGVSEVDSTGSSDTSSVDEGAVLVLSGSSGSSKDVVGCSVGTGMLPVPAGSVVGGSDVGAATVSGEDVSIKTGPWLVEDSLTSSALLRELLEKMLVMKSVKDVWRSVNELELDSDVEDKVDSGDDTVSALVMVTVVFSN